MHAVFLDLGSLFPADLDLSPLQAAFAELTLHEATAPEAVAARIAEAEVIITNKVRLSGELLAQAPRLKLILVAATGVNNVDMEAAAARGIAVSNCQGYGTAAVVQHALALMLALATRLPQYQQAVAAGLWQHSRNFCLMDFPIMELAGKRLGIVGYGELGRALARVAEALGMQVLVAARPGTAAAEGRLPLEQLLPQVDVLSLHCPLTPQTQGLIGADELRAMPRHSLLINTARGGIVDEAALAAALRAGEIGGAGVDVLSEEPPRNGNPLLRPDIPNLIVTPHSAWGSVEARQRIIGQLAENAQAHAAGSPLRRLT
jgi:glycerate dehydrogenase